MSDDPRFNDDYHVMQREVVRKITGESVKDGLHVSVVPRMENYETDESLCLTSVVFPPADLGESIKANLIDPLRKLEPCHYYYPTRSLHVTIKNIRTIAKPANFGVNQISAANSVLSTIVPTFSRFSLSLQDLVAFENSAAIIGYSDRTLRDLILSLDNALHSAGIPDDKQYVSDSIFFGSMTVCRFRKPPSAKFMALLSRISAGLDEEFQVNVIRLIVCNAVCHPKNRRTEGEYHLLSEPVCSR